jgi:hypothetical protein
MFLGFDNMCELQMCERKSTRIVETVGLGRVMLLCGYCCRSMIYHYKRNYTPQDVYESKNENDWPQVGYQNRYLMVWRKI